MLRAIGFGVTVAAGLAVSQPVAQQPSFRAGTDLVRIDVSVLDRNRHPVAGLRAQDFRVIDDGQEREIVAFSAVEVADSFGADAPWATTYPKDVVTNDLSEHRLFVILISDRSSGDQAVEKAKKKIALDFIRQLAPSDLAAVVFTRDNRRAQDFTSDRAKLVAAVEHMTFGFGGRLSVRALAGVVDELSTVPDRRKALVFIGADIEFDPARLAPGLRGPDPGIHSEIRAILLDMFRTANRANINIYCLDPNGLVPPRDGTESGFDPHRGERDNLLMLASNTGGYAFVNSDEFDRGIRQVFLENSSYYLLGYRQPEASTDGGFRRVQVRVTRPGLEVRTREGYWPDQRAQLPSGRKVAPPTPTTRALAGLLPNAGLPLRATAAAFAGPDQKSVVTWVLGLRASGAESPAIARDEIDVELRAFDPDGRARGSWNQFVVLAPKSGAVGDFDVLSHVELPAGRYALRAAVSSRLRKEQGSVYFDVEVPDFARDALALSGVLINATGAPSSGPRNGVPGNISITPTTLRIFDSKEKASAFLRVYQGLPAAKSALVSVEMVARIRDASDSVVFDRAADLSPADFGAARVADYRLDIPVQTLGSGSYLLTIEAVSASKRLQRAVRFTVR